MMLKGFAYCLAAACLAATSAYAANNVTSWRYDSTRAGQNLNETQLTPAQVNVTNFGKLYSYVVDGYVYAQPLYVGALNIGGTAHNVLFVATEHDTVYAFDADRNQSLWQASLLDAAHGAAAGATPVPSADVGSHDIVPEIGITGTPVIDPVGELLYVVSKTKENGVYVSRLHALDLVTGNEKAGSPVVIQGSVPGAGAGSVNGTIAFLPEWELNRTGLLLFNNHVYVAFAAHGDNGPYHGWIFAYNAATLQQTALFNSSPGGRGNGIWHSGAALAADTVNGVPRLFFATGNFLSTNNLGPNPTPPYTSAQNYSNAIMRMDLSNGGLTVSDEWTPFDQQQLSAADTDQTSGGLVLLPDQPGAHVHELVQVGKNGRIEVLDRDDLGGFNSTVNEVVQEVSGQITGLWSTPAYWNNNLYFWGSGDTLKQFSLTNGKLSTTPIFASVLRSGFPGASPVVSSNGNTDGVVWAVRSDQYNNGNPEVLYAFNATNVSTPLYLSSTNAARDSAGKAVKFVVPVVTNGKVYVGAQGEVDVYGLLAAATPTAPAPTVLPAPGTYAAAQTITLADSLNGATIYYTIDGSPPSTAATRYTGPFLLSATHSVKALAVAGGYNSSGVTSGTYTIGNPPAIDFSNGFSSVKGLTLNGSALNSDDSRLQLTAGNMYEAGSVFTNVPVNVQSFVTDFTFQLSGTAPIGDGITFTIQAQGPTALGPMGGGLGYGPSKPGGTVGIAHSVALKFDLFSNAGEGANSTGLYVNGASPTIPAVDLTASKIILSSGDTISAHLVYDGSYLYVTLKDPVNGAFYAIRFRVDIPSTIGSRTAYVGFTGGTGGYIASQKILTWTYAPQPTLGSVTFKSESLPAVSSGPTFRSFAWDGFPDGVGTVLDSTKVGDNVAFTLNFPKAGTYNAKISSKNWLVRAKWSMKVDGLIVTSPQDEYTETPVYRIYDLGPVVINTAGKHTLTFTVVGINPLAKDWKISFDDLSFDER